MDKTDNKPSSEDIRFHHIRGGSVELDEDRRTARLTSDKGSAVAFSSEPVLPNEIISFRFTEFREHHDHSAVWVGFTRTDPATLDSVTSWTTQLPGFKTWRLPGAFQAKISSSAVFFILLCKSGAQWIKADETSELNSVGITDDAQLPHWFVIEFWGRASAVELIGKPRESSRPRFTTIISRPRLLRMLPLKVETYQTDEQNTHQPANHHDDECVICRAMRSMSTTPRLLVHGRRPLRCNADIYLNS